LTRHGEALSELSNEIFGGLTRISRSFCLLAPYRRHFVTSQSDERR
jgi:hypothetical protein